MVSVLVGAFAVDLQLVAFVVLDLARFRSGDQVADELGAVTFLALLHGLQHQGQVLLALELFLRIGAVVAALVAFGRIEVLAEVVQQVFAAAHAGLGEAHRIGQQLFADLLLGHGLALQELLQLLDVLVAVEGHTLAFAAVTSRTSRLLVVALQALRDVVVDHETHIGLVDAHAEGDGGHDHIHLLHEELVLVTGALVGIHAGVVGQCLDAVHVQHLGHFLHLLPAEAVNDAAATGVLFDEADDLAAHVLLGADLVVQVGAIEAGLVRLGVRNVEVLQDVLLHLFRGRGGQRDHGHPLDLIEDGAQAAVLGAEVVAPLADAVRLVNGEEADLDVGEELHVLPLRERFGGHVQDLCPAVLDVLADLQGLVAREGTVQEVRHAVLIAEAAQGVHLVLHQRDERAHHDGGAFHHERGQLVAHALASAGGHDHKSVLAIQNALDDGLLFALEGVETEKLLEGFPRGQVYVDHCFSLGTGAGPFFER